MSILSVSETFRHRHDGKECLVIDFSIGQNGLNEKPKDVICIFEVFGEAEVGQLQWFVLLEQRNKEHASCMSRCWGDNNDESLFSAFSLGSVAYKYTTVLQPK